MHAHKKCILVLISSVCLLAASCGGTGGAAEGRTGKAERSAAEGGTSGAAQYPDSGLVAPTEMDDIGPNEARVHATVTAIYDERASSGPCAEAPCRATIRIDSLLGYGSAFPRPLSKGEHLEVQFAFTLADTDELDLNVDRSYPGLSAGEAFWADLQGRSVPGGMSFSVHRYYRAND